MILLQSLLFPQIDPNIMMGRVGILAYSNNLK